jgi:hypothetical protein
MNTLLLLLVLAAPFLLVCGVVAFMIISIDNRTRK